MNKLKTPPLTQETTILCFDAESNGLHGDAFAIGAVVVNMQGEVLDSFAGRCNITEAIDNWVQQNVIPAISNMDVTHSGKKHLRDHFWSWFSKAKESADYVVVQNGYPVEYRLMMQCQQDDIDSRYWDHPFPVLDLTSLAIAKKMDMKSIKSRVQNNHSEQVQGSVHNPVYDATLSAFMTIDILKN